MGIAFDEQNDSRTPRVSQKTGRITTLFIATGLVKSEGHAQVAMIAITALCVALTAYIIFI